MGEEKKPTESSKVEIKEDKEKKKIWDNITTSDVVALIVSFLGFVSIFYDVFSIDIGFMNPIITMINDASGFMTFICISCIVYQLVHRSSNEKTIIGHLFFPIVGIVLINKLHSNSTWWNIYVFLDGLDGRHIAFAVAIIIAIFYICYKLWQFIKQPKEPPRFDEEEGKEEKEKSTKVTNGEKKEEPTRKVSSGGKNKSSGSKKSANSKIDTFATVIISILVAIVVFVLLDDYFVNKGNFDVIRPSVLLLIPNIRYVGFVVIPTLIVPFLCFPLLKRINAFFRLLCGKDSKDKDDSIFHVTALLALVLEISGIFVLDKVKLLDIGDTFLSFLTEDVFAFLLYGSLLFLVIQIALIVFFGICFHTGLDNEIVKELKGKIVKIEKTIVKIACDLLLGCLGLFDFLPDFFKTIGLLLLGKEYEEEPDGSDAKPKGDTSTTAGTSSKNNSAPSDRENG